MIQMNEYAKRRKKLMQAIGASGIVIIPSAPERFRNGDAHYSYRQNSDFYYLTGFEEPEAVLVLIPKRKEGEYVLFNRIRDPEHEIWDGPRAGQAGAKKQFLADEAFPIKELAQRLPEMLAGHDTVHYPIGFNKAFDKILMHAVNQTRAKMRSGMQAPTKFVDISPSLHELRLLKSAAEIDVMRKAVEITAAAHREAMEVCRPGMYEYELEAEIMYQFQRHGARYAAYNSIVGSGRNACILHYILNDKKIANGDLILIDAGAEYKNYAADITRTFPANGKYTSEQSTIYELVLESQLAGIKAVKPGAVWTTAQTAIIKVLTQGLVDLGILKGSVDGLIEKKAYLPFYMHNSGHWLGLDVHDVGRYRVNNKWRLLEPGMVLTVEPGLYISASPKVNKRWHNIGVRIEDDVLVTAKGNDVMSRMIPKKIKEIEAIMAR